MEVDSVETLLILWVLCAGLAYLIARDRAPSRAALATFLGFVFGPVGVGITFLLSDGRPEAPAASDSTSEASENTVQVTVPEQPMRTPAEIRRDLAKLRENLSKRD